MSTRYGCRFVTVLPHGRFTRLDRKGKLSNFGEKFQIANRVLISKKPWVGTRHFFLQRTSPEHQANLKIAQIRFSSRMAIRYRPVSSLPVVVEGHFAYTTYGILNR